MLPPPRRLRCRRSVRAAARALRSRPGRALSVLAALGLGLWVALRLLHAVTSSGPPPVPPPPPLDRKHVDELRQGGQVPLCRAPKLPELPAGNASVWEAGPDCPDRQPLLLLAANRLQLNASHPWAPNVTRCRVRGLEWRSDSEAAATQEQQFLPAELGVQVLHDFVLAQCDVAAPDGGVREVRQVLVQASPKDLVHRRIMDQRQLMGRHQRPDILIFVVGDVDVRRRRQILPQTMSYLDILRAVDLPGLTGTSYDIKDNVVALLTGRHLHELPNARRGTTSAQYVDIFNFVWYEFEKQGYATLLAEDVALNAAFNKDLHGFEQSPTDHYMRPFWLEMGNSPCIHGRRRHEYTFNFVRDFFFNYRNVSKLAVVVHHPGEEGNPSAAALDHPLAQLLTTLAAGGLERNLALLVLGLPHRPTSFDSAAPEESETARRLALGQVVLPPWFAARHRAMAENLARSTGQMTTFFDLNLLLRDLTQVDAPEPGLGPAREVHAHSLLRPMIREKNCAGAGLPLPWCTCVRRDALRITDAEALGAARHMASRIDALTEPYRSSCAHLGRVQLLYADLFTPKTKDTIRVRGGPAHIRDEKKITTYYFHIVIRAEGAVFAGVVGLDKMTGDYNTFTESIACVERPSKSFVEDQRVREICIPRT